MSKISICFFDDKEVRAVWDDEKSKWWFSVLDIIAVLRSENDYKKNRSYWKYLKTKLKKEDSQLVSAANQLKLTAADGKKYLTDTLDYAGIAELAKNFPSKRANRFIEWVTYSDETIDGKSKSKAYALFDSSPLGAIEVGSVKGLQQIHAYLFGGLYEFAGQIRSLNIAKSGFRFATARFLDIPEQKAPRIRCDGATAPCLTSINADNGLRSFRASGYNHDWKACGGSGEKYRE